MFLVIRQKLNRLGTKLRLTYAIFSVIMSKIKKPERDCVIILNVQSQGVL